MTKKQSEKLPKFFAKIDTNKGIAKPVWNTGLDITVCLQNVRILNNTVFTTSR